MNRKPIREKLTFFQKWNTKNKVSLLRNTLDRLHRLISWENFRPILASVRKPLLKGGRPPYDEVFIFKCLVLQELYGLSDEEVEDQIADRSSFQKFLGMDITSDIPEYATLNNFRNLLEERELVGKLHAAFTHYLTEHGLCLRSGLIADATFVETPRRR